MSFELSESDKLLSELSDRSYVEKTKARRTNERLNLWAANKRLELIEIMGGKCQHPNCETPDAKLEFHHRNRCRTWIARRKNRVMRMILYRREHKAGMLLLLCRVCNKKHKNWGFDL